MDFFKNIKIGTKIIMSVSVILFLFSVVSIYFNVSSQLKITNNEIKDFTERSLMEAKTKLKMVADTLSTAIEGKSKEEIIEIINVTRYGGGKEYFWINDLKEPYPMMVFHPISSALTGKEFKNEKYNIVGEEKRNFLSVLSELCKKMEKLMWNIYGLNQMKKNHNEN